MRKHLKGSVVNGAWPNLNVGSLENTSTVPLRKSDNSVAIWKMKSI